MLNAFSLAGIILAITCFFLTVVLYIFGKSKLHRMWALFNLTVGLWGIGAFYLGQIKDPQNALLVWRLVHITIIFIPILNYHVVYFLCGLSQPILIRLIYAQGIIFSFLTLFSSSFIPKVRFVFDSFYYDVAGPIFYVFFLIWGVIVGYSHFLLVWRFLKSDKRLKNQILYFFVGTGVGFSGGITNFLPALGINFYPFGNFTIPLYCLIVSYAILRYRLLDVTIAITRTGIFIVVYSLVLGIPFALAFGWQQYLINLIGPHWWMVPLISSTVLATAGPYIYLYIQKRAEDRLLQEQRQYQSTLRQASLGMGRVKDLKKLLNLIVHIVTRAVRIEHCSIYLLHDASNKFVLKASKNKKLLDEQLSTFPIDSMLIEYLKKYKDPIVAEEVKQKKQDFEDPTLVALDEILTKLDAALLVPSFIEDRLISFIILGKKKSGKLYAQDDLAVFSILANQSALAIENAQFYEDMKKTHEQLFKAEKMATIGTMADGLSHQMNNRLHAMGFIAGDAIDTIKLKKNNLSPDTQQLLDEIQHALERIQENVRNGGEIVQGLLKYSRKGEEGFAPVELDKLVSASIEMVQFKVKLTEINIIRNFNHSTPKIWGNFTQLQEVFFNLIDNANDAMAQRKNDLNENGYKGTVEISVDKKGKNLEIIFADNGMGVKKEDINKIFTPFFTTKLSSKKGTGLGLYVIRQIIEENHNGKVVFNSEFGRGSIMHILLPIAQEDSAQ